MNKGKETVSIVLSALLAFLLFFFFFTKLKFGLLLSMVLAVGAYIALTFLLKPSGRIGKVSVDTVKNGELLLERLEEGEKDYKRLEKAAAQIKEEELGRSCRELLDIAESILKYLKDNPEKIMAARRYMDYYQETAVHVLENYIELRETKLATREAEEIIGKTREAVETLKDAFQLQLQKLMENELMDMEADLNLLKQTFKSEGFTYDKETKE